MSFAKALSSAVSGLTANARSTETVAANVANAMTKDYARRELALSVQTMGGAGGGVRIDGVTRAVNTGILAEMRLAIAAQAEADTTLGFMTQMEVTIGLPGDAAALSTALTSFQSALQEASARPDDEIRLAGLLSSAQTLTDRLNKASNAIQSQRSQADAAIASDVSTLNDTLARVAYLNRRITIISGEGKDVSSLMDERQAQINRIGSIIPVQEVARDAGQVALFTTEGGVLLDGNAPSQFEFQTTPQVTAEMSVGNPPLGRLVVNGGELTAAQMRLFAGGSLSANFAIRDDLAPEIQQELDALALDLHDRFADSTVDPSLSAAGPGLFTDGGTRAEASSLTGFAARIAINNALDPNTGGSLWRLRTGIGANASGAEGDSSQLLRWVDAINTAMPPPAAGIFAGNSSLGQRFATLEARVSTRQVNAESNAATRNSRTETITLSFMADGVDSDAEMQTLLQLEQAYAANARVIQAIDDMMQQVLRW